MDAALASWPRLHPVQRLTQIKTLLEKCLKEAIPQDAGYIKSALRHVEHIVKAVDEAMGATPKEETVNVISQPRALTKQQKLTIIEICSTERNYVTSLNNMKVCDLTS